MLKKILKIFVTFFIYYPIYGVSFLTPRKKGRWVFGTGDKFFDNSKYLYLEVIEQKPEIDAVWLTTSKELCEDLVSKGFKVRYLYSLKGCYYLLTANVYISSYLANNHLPIWLMGRARHVNLWHGIGLKNMDFKSSMPKLYKSYYHPILKYIYKPFRVLVYRKPTRFLSTSPYMTQHFQECFQLKESVMMESNYPRCAPFFWDYSRLLRHIEKVEGAKTLALIQTIQQYDHSYIYMPTWRDNNPYYLQDAGIDFSKLNHLMKLKNSIFILKLHPSTPSDSLPNLSLFENIIVLDKTIDIYPILPLVDTLVTDYSSIYYDFLLFENKSTIFFVFDYDTYLSQNRDLALPFFEYVEGQLAYNFAELYQTLETASFLSSDDANKKKKLVEFFWGKQESKLDLVSEVCSIE